MSFPWGGSKLHWQIRGGVVLLKVMKFAKGTTRSFKWSGIGKPGKVMTERMALKKKKTKALRRKTYQQAVELIVKSKKKPRVN